MCVYVCVCVCMCVCVCCALINIGIRGHMHIAYSIIMTIFNQWRDIIIVGGGVGHHCGPRDRQGEVRRTHVHVGRLNITS